MKKVLSLAIIMIMMLIVLTGCVNVNYEITLNKDGSADVAYIYGIEKSALQQMGTTAESMTEEMKKNAEESEYTIEAYSDDTMEGFKASKHVENLSDISLSEAFGEENVTDSEENQFKVEKKGLKSVYSQNANIDLSSMDTSTASMVTMKYTVNLPTAVGENNADEVSNDNKTLTWNLEAGAVNEINFEASSSIPVVTIIVIAIIAIVVIGAIVILVKKLKKNKKESTDTIVDVEDIKENETKEEPEIEEEKQEQTELEDDDEKEDEE